MPALAVLGALAAATGAAITAPIVGREFTKATQVLRGTATPEIQREYEKPVVQAASREAHEIVQKSLSKTRAKSGFYTYDASGIRTDIYIPIPETLTYNIPGVRAFSAQTYESAMASLLIKKGYSRDKALQVARGMQELYRAESAGEATGALIASAGGEAVGASVSQSLLRGAAARAGGALGKGAAKTVATRVAAGSAVGGIYEAGTQEFTRQLAGYTYRGGKLEPEQVALQAGFGALTAGIAGGIIGGVSVKTSKGAKGLLGAAYAIDPYEAPGDILAARIGQVAGGKKAPEVVVPILRGGTARVKVPKIGGLAAAFTQTEAFVGGQKVKGKFVTKESIYGGKYVTFVPTQKPMPSVVPTLAITPAIAPTPATAFTPAEVPTPAETETPAEVPTPAETETPAEVPTPAETETPAEYHNTDTDSKRQSAAFYAIFAAFGWRGWRKGLYKKGRFAVF